MTKAIYVLMMALIERFFDLGSNENMKMIKQLLKEMERFQEKHGIEDIRFGFVMQLCRLDIQQKLTYLFDAHCALTKDIIEYLYKKVDWDLLDIRIAACAIHATDNAEMAIFIYNKILKVRNEKYPDFKTHRHVEMMLAFNLSLSLLKMHYLKLNKKNPNVDIRKSFQHYIEIAITLAKKEKHRFL